MDSGSAVDELAISQVKQVISECASRKDIPHASRRMREPRGAAEVAKLVSGKSGSQSGLPSVLVWI
jgi:hypothetical protein